VAEPLLVEVRRNGVVEAVHRVHAVAMRAGEVVATVGDPFLTCFMRSASKPLQALPLVRARDDLPDDELAIACASHRDTPEQVAAVRALLARAEQRSSGLIGVHDATAGIGDDHELAGGFEDLDQLRGAALRGAALLEPPPALGQVRDLSSPSSPGRPHARRSQVRHHRRGGRFEPRRTPAIGNLLGIRLGHANVTRSPKSKRGA